MDPEIQKELLKNMRGLMQEAGAKAFFNEPVDPEALGIPEYPLIIKEPMDLGKIFWKLKDSNYKHVKHFFEDLNLVWSNCQKFNQKGSAVYIASEKLDQRFQALWSRSKKVLKLDENDANLGILPKTGASEVPEGTKRKRLATSDTEPTKPSTSSSPQNTNKTSKLKIRLGKNQKTEQEPTGVIVSSKEKAASLDSKTISQLELCIKILHQILSSPDALALVHAPVSGSFMSLSEICASLVAAKEKNWTSSQYSSSKDVLHEAQLFLKKQAVENEHRRKTLKAFNELLEQLEKSWMEAGLGEDLEGLKYKGNEQGKDVQSLPDSNLRVTKARMEKLKRQQMEKEVKVAQNASLELENLKIQIEEAKNEMEKIKEKAKEQAKDLDSQYRSKLSQLADLTKQKTQVQRRRDRAISSITSAHNAIDRLKEKQEKVKMLKEEEVKLLEALGQHNSQLEVQPRDAVIVDIRTYSPKKQKAETQTEVDINQLGEYWFNLNK